MLIQQGDCMYGYIEAEIPFSASAELIENWSFVTIGLLLLKTPLAASMPNEQNQLDCSAQ